MGVGLRLFSCADFFLTTGVGVKNRWPLSRQKLPQSKEDNMLADLVRKNRSYRRFHEDDVVDEATLRELVDLSRYCASAANLQPLKYQLSCDPKKNAVIFEHLAWAGYLKDWNGPMQGERPGAYIVVLRDATIAKTIDCDHGIACQTMLLAAVEKGLGGCMIGAVKRKKLCRALDIPGHLEILLVIALGKPKEDVVIEAVGSNGDIKYWRDSDDVHHVPKRSLEEIIIP